MRAGVLGKMKGTHTSKSGGAERVLCPDHAHGDANDFRNDPVSKFVK